MEPRPLNVAATAAQADKSLCFGWTWSAPSPDELQLQLQAAKLTSKPGGGSCAQFDAPFPAPSPNVASSSRNCTHGVNAKDPAAKPPPAAPRKAPKGAKNVSCSLLHLELHSLPPSNLTPSLPT